MKYTMEIAGVSRDLQLFPVSDDVCIAAFILFGDVEVTEAAAKELLARAPKFDVLFTAEAKSIPLIYEMAKQAGMNEYVVARKAPKLYMEDLISTDVDSITTQGIQTLCIGKRETEMIRGKDVLIVDDVISTGGSLLSMSALIEKAGGNIVGKMAVLAEGDAMERDDIIALHKLPLFDSEGNIIG